MPIYEYECTSCHHHFDLIQKISDEPIKICPECSKNTVVKLVSAAGFQLKGTGWYATDFKDKGKPGKSSDKKNSSDTSSENSPSENKTKESAATSPAEPSKSTEQSTTKEKASSTNTTTKGDS